MKILLFRFEGDKIHFIECNITNDSFVLGKREGISLESTLSRGEKYKKVTDELLLLNTKYSPDLYVCQLPQKYMGKIMDPEGFGLSCILSLFTFTNYKKILELTHSYTRGVLGIPEKDFKQLLEKTKEYLIIEYKIGKSDKLLEGLCYLYLIKPE